jgi:hypothetical protein
VTKKDVENRTENQVIEHFARIGIKRINYGTHVNWVLYINYAS